MAHETVEALLEASLSARGATLREALEHAGVSRHDLSLHPINQKTADTLARLTGSTALYWLNASRDLPDTPAR